jgi:YkoY family integral membrane protein
MLIVFLAFLEGILSIDNALVLALMARHLPEKKQRKALTYGLIGSVIFRLAALSIVTKLMQWVWVKYLGGGYLVIIALHHLLRDSEKNPEKLPKFARGFWSTVVLIELMDIAFAVDSILAAVALSNKLWIVFLGGMMGVVLMRFSAVLFIKALNVFPHFETTAYLLVLLIGVKLLIEGFHPPGVNFHDTSNPAFWALWVSFVLCILYGFKPKSKKDAS